MVRNFSIATPCHNGTARVTWNTPNFTGEYDQIVVNLENQKKDPIHWDHITNLVNNNNFEISIKVFKSTKSTLVPQFAPVWSIINISGVKICKSKNYHLKCRILVFKWAIPFFIRTGGWT